MPPAPRTRSLRIVRRADRGGALTIVGTVDGEPVRQRAQSDDLALAWEEAAQLQAQILRRHWHGERRGARSFAEAIHAYRTSRERRPGTIRRLARILRALGDVSLAEVDQAALDRLRRVLLKPEASPATVRRGLITPVRAVLRHAHRRGWCDAPAFEIPPQPEGRTRYLLPEEATRLLAAAAPHLAPLLLLLIGTGARLSEALELDWRDVDLVGARAIFWRTKTGRRRIAALPPATVAALGALKHRTGPVILTARGLPYSDRGREMGGQIRRAWKTARTNAGLDPGLTPHDLRHTWASWHYALEKDLLVLKVAGGWSSVTLVERYAHLLPAGQQPAIRAFLGLAAHPGRTGLEENLATA